MLSAVTEIMYGETSIRASLDIN